MKWIVKYYDYDIAAITDYDLFPYFEAFLLKLKNYYTPSRQKKQDKI